VAKTQNPDFPSLAKFSTSPALTLTPRTPNPDARRDRGGEEEEAIGGKKDGRRRDGGARIEVTAHA